MPASPRGSRLHSPARDRGGLGPGPGRQRKARTPKREFKSKNSPLPSTHTTLLTPDASAFFHTKQFSKAPWTGTGGTEVNSIRTPTAPSWHGPPTSRVPSHRTAPASKRQFQVPVTTCNPDPPAAGIGGSPNSFLKFPHFLEQLAGLRKTVYLPDDQLAKKATVQQQPDERPKAPPRPPSSEHLRGFEPEALQTPSYRVGLRN